MHIILGANGHIGSALAKNLLEQGEPVTAVIHSADNASDWEKKGAKVEVADVHDTDDLRRIFRQGTRLFLLNPPADPSTDADKEERKSLLSILAALDGSGLEKVVAQSSYGAQQGESIGDLGVLYEMEQALASQPILATIIRGAYYMSNWDMALPMAQQKGKVPTFYPPDFKLPMVAPQDIAQLVAQLLQEPTSTVGLHSIEGPELYSSDDVAASFESALQKPVLAVQIPHEGWIPALQGMGFSEKSAQSFANMTDLTLNQPTTTPDMPIKGATTLQQYISDIVGKATS